MIEAVTQIVPLNNVDHAELRVSPRGGAAFGDAANQVALFPAEFEAAAREFPIFLRRAYGSGLHAVALLGFDRDENLFLDGERWTSRYVPAIQRRGPFLIGVSGSDPAADATIQVDMVDPRVGVEDGHSVFHSQGGATPYLDAVAHALRVIHAGPEAAAALYAAWQAAGLLEPVSLDIELDERTRYQVPDLITVGEAALARLDSATLARLNAAGQLRPAFALLASTGNVAELIARKNRRRERA